MIYDKRYEDNIVLKREAFQNLLTHIKNYPIVDIDYVQEGETDVLHGNDIWNGYTEDSPCLKITYGDERSLKGNIVFAQAEQKAIEENKKLLREARLNLNNAVYTQEKLKVAYEENKKVQQEKEDQLERINANWDVIARGKEAFLKAGLSVLNFPFSSVYTNEEDLIGNSASFADLTQETNGPLSSSRISYSYENIDINYEENTPETLKTIKTKNIKYSTLSQNARLIISNELNSLKTNKRNGQDIFSTTEQLFIENFADFVIKYNYLTFTKTLKEAGFTQEQIDGIRAQDSNGTLYNLSAGTIEMIHTKLAEMTSDPLWQWQENSQPNFDEIKTIFKRYIQEVIDKITNIINTNIIRINDEYQAQNSIIEDLTSQINDLEATIDGLNKSILSYAGDNVIYGYKYVKVGSSIKWNQNYDEVLEKQENTSDTQTSGSFRIHINKHTYEVPIKGFSEKTSNVPINIKTSKQINMLGNIAGSGSIVTNNGHIYASSGAVVAGTYLAVRGYPVDTNGNRISTYVPANTAGFWYDGRENKDLLRTWNIVKDNNNTRLGTYQLALINGNSEIGIRNENGILEARNIPSDNSYVDFKSKNLIATQSVLPIITDIQDIGSPNLRWRTVYASKMNVSELMNIDITSNPIAKGSTGNLLSVSYKDREGMTYSNKPILRAIGTGKSIGGANASFYFGSPEGTTVIGAGERASESLNYLTAYDDENIYLIADSEIKLYTNAQTAASPRLGLHINTSGETILGGKLTVPTNIVANGSITVGTTASIGSNASITGTLGVGGQLTASGVVKITKGTNASSKTTGSLIVTGGIGCSGDIYGNKLYNAVYNDYAEYRTTIDLKPGTCVIDCDDGSLKKSEQRLQPGAQIISDTFGHAMGETPLSKTPLAVAGRVLAYPYQDRSKYHAGMAVCSAPNGTIDIMSREEIKDYPDCIIGIVSEIPSYETWGSDDIKVNNRIWIKV